MDSPRDRLRYVAPLARLDAVRAEPVVSHSNDAWFIDDVVLRVCWRGDRRRLLREATILEHLPASVPHASVVDAGTTPDGDLTWLVTRRLPGRVLRDIWDGLDASARTSALEQHGAALAALHDWPPPEVVVEALDVALEPEATDDEIIGRTVVPLPVGRVRRLLPALASMVPPSVHGAVAERLDQLAPFDPFEAAHDTVVHADAHLQNILWHDGRIVALLDFEWARLGPLDLDLEVFTRGADVTLADVTPALRESHPAMFEHRDLASRLLLYELAHLVRQVLISERSDQLTEQLREVATRPCPQPNA